MDILNWSEAAPGVWRAVVGSLSSVTPLSIVNAQPRMAALEKLPEQAFPFDVSRITVRSVLYNRIVTVPLEEDERIYGFGLQFMRLNQRGKTRFLRVNSDPQQDTGETHAPIPFYVSSRSYGVLVNTSRVVTVHCGSRVQKETGPQPEVRGRLDPLWRPTPVSNAVEIVVPVDGFELFVFRGATMLDVVCRHNLFVGGRVYPAALGTGVLASNAHSLRCRASHR